MRAIADSAITRILVPIVGSLALLPFSIDMDAARPAFFGAIVAAQLLYEFVGTAV